MIRDNGYNFPLMENIHTDRAPKAIGPYSQAVRSGGFLFLSGQIPIDPVTGEVVGSDIEAQAEQVLKNVRAVVEAAGLNLNHVVKTGVFLTDLSEFAKFNNVYQTFFGSHRPARSTVQVAALPKGARLEMDAVCVDQMLQSGGKS